MTEQQKKDVIFFSELINVIKRLLMSELEIVTFTYFLDAEELSDFEKELDTMTLVELYCLLSKSFYGEEQLIDFTLKNLPHLEKSYRKWLSTEKIKKMFDVSDQEKEERTQQINERHIKLTTVLDSLDNEKNYIDYNLLVKKIYEKHVNNTDKEGKVDTENESEIISIPNEIENDNNISNINQVNMLNLGLNLSGNSISGMIKANPINNGSFIISPFNDQINQNLLSNYTLKHSNSKINLSQNQK